MDNLKRAGVLPFLMAKCPRCGKGQVFSHSILSTKFSDTYECCPKCKLNYEPETGFFFGAMYWSYAMIVGGIITGSVILSLLGYFDYALYVLPLLLVVSLPVIFRYSRLLMLYVVYPIMYKNKFYGNDNSQL